MKSVSLLTLIACLLPLLFSCAQSDADDFIPQKLTRSEGEVSAPEPTPSGDESSSPRPTQDGDDTSVPEPLRPRCETCVWGTEKEKKKHPMRYALIEYFFGPAPENADLRLRMKKSFMRHFDDSNEYYPNPQKLATFPIPAAQKVRGTQLYFNLFRRDYKYDVTTNDNGILITVKVFIRDKTRDELTKLIQHLEGAQALWNNRVPKGTVSYNVLFNFEIVDKSEGAHFSVSLMKDTVGPYDTFWNPEWSSWVLAHEMGHTMGLADEYDEYRRVSDCWESSTMCFEGPPEPQPYHYYHIFRRLYPKSQGR